MILTVKAEGMVENTIIIIFLIQKWGSFMATVGTHFRSDYTNDPVCFSLNPQWNVYSRFGPVVLLLTSRHNISFKLNIPYFPTPALAEYGY